MPLPSAEITSTSSSGGSAVAAWRVEVVDVDRGERGEFLDLAFAQALSGGAPDRVDRAGLSNEPRVASIAASWRSPWECRSAGRFSAASAGCRFGWPRSR